MEPKSYDDLLDYTTFDMVQSDIGKYLDAVARAESDGK